MLTAAFIVFFVMVGLGPLVVYCWPDPRRHQRCLESIRKLEPELFPDLWPEWRWVKWEPAEEYKWEQANPILGPTREQIALHHTRPSYYDQPRVMVGGERLSIEAKDYALMPDGRPEPVQPGAFILDHMGRARGDWVTSLMPGQGLETEPRRR